MSLRSSRLSGSLAMRIAVTSSSYVERASTGESLSSSTRAISRRSSSASPVEYCLRVPFRDCDRVVLVFGMIPPPAMPIRYLGLDGDDTLWHNETRFHLTQTALGDLLRRHVPDADVDTHLSEVEMRNLSLYGYGVKAFTLSMLETAIRVTDGRIPTADLEVILGWGKKMLGEPTELLDGVEAALQALNGRYELLLITKGDLFDQESKLARSGLAEMFAGVEILSEKNEDAYRSVLRRRHIDPKEFVMV